MATGYVNPNGDGSTTQWTASGSAPYYPYVSKGVQSPTAPSTSTYIGPDKGVIDEFSMETISSVASVSDVTVWYYGSSGSFLGSFCPIRISVFLAGAWIDFPSGYVDMTGSNQWASQGFSGTWTQSDLDSLQIRIDADNSGPGASATIYAIYAEITYTPSGGSGPANLKTWNTVPEANIKTYDTVTLANLKTLNTIA